MAAVSGDTRTGVVARLIRDKGFGFITEDQTGEERFFHRSSVDQFDALTEGNRVRYQANMGPKGPRAERVERL